MTLYLIVGIFLLQLGDYWTTTKVIKRGGVETNPIVVRSMEIFGEQAGLILAKLWVVLLLSAMEYCGYMDGQYAESMLWGMNVFYGWVVLHNYDVLKGME